MVLTCSGVVLMVLTSNGSVVQRLMMLTSDGVHGGVDGVD